MTTSIYNTKFVIYKHTNIITQKSYIGKTIYGVKMRWQQHVSATCRNDDTYFYNSIRKHGTDCWTHEILYVSFEKDDQHLYEVEEQLITDYDTFYNGYNSDGGGRGSASGELNHNYGKKRTNETKQKMSIAQSGEKSFWYGKKHSEESKRKVSISRIGERNHQFKGYYIYDNIKYTSSYSLGDLIGVSNKSIRTWYKDLNKLISNSSYSHSKFLQSLGTKEEIVGLTYKKLGFKFMHI